MKKPFFLLILIFSFAKFEAQKENLLSFNTVSLNYHFQPKVFLFSAIQVRGNEDYTKPSLYDVYLGLGYNLSKNNIALLGTGTYFNYKEKELNKEEFRIWIQDIVNLKSGVFKFENRLRVEQSWFYNLEKHQSSTRNRFRYRLNISAPLNSKKVEKGTLSANIYDEVFFVTPQEPSFARNRVYAGFSYLFSKELSLSSGYLWQREFEALSNKNYHYLFLSFNINLHAKQNQPKILHPHIPD